MEKITKHAKVILILVILQFLLDMLYVYLYPTVNPIRATFIGTSALIVLFIPFVNKLVNMRTYIAFLPVYSSALFGSLLVQADVVKSKSAASGIAHVAILIMTYIIIISVNQIYKKKNSV